MAEHEATEFKRVTPTWDDLLPTVEARNAFRRALKEHPGWSDEKIEQEFPEPFSPTSD